MPIATVFVRSDVEPLDDKSLARLVPAWASHSGQPAGHMTVNIVDNIVQAGAGFALMAWLDLPDLWPGDAVDALQTGLARALSDTFEAEIGEVQVITRVVASGHVVEDGAIVRWSA